MSEDNILGAILAGGQSKRMGQDKLFLELNNRKLIEYTIDKVKKYLKNVIIITNQENEFFLKKNLITVKDCIKGQLGPLVGILTAMKWAKENEYFVWTYFIENNILFNPDNNLMNQFIFDAPFSKFYLEIDNESSEKIGKYIGWQIVKSYMNNNDVSLTELLKTSPTDIYDKSKYKPNK